MNKIFYCMIAMVILASFSAFGDDTNYDMQINLVNQDPDPSIAGGTMEVRIGVQNNGGYAVQDVILEIDPEYPFTAADGWDSKISLGTVKVYQTSADLKIAKFKLKVAPDAIAGQYNIKVKQYILGAEDVYITNSFNVEVKNKESAEIVYIDKTVLVPGEITPMIFTVYNVGSAPIKNLQFAWSNAEGIILPVGSDNTKYVNYIEVGQSVDLDYDVVASTLADPGLYQLDLTLDYEDPITGEEKVISTIAGVNVGGGTDFEVAYSEVSGSEYSFTIANIGSNPATSVSVIVPSQTSWKATGSNSMIIGNLNKGDYTVASFTLQQMGSMPSAANERSRQMNATQQDNGKLTVQVSYTDTLGVRQTVEKEVTVGSTASATTNGASTSYNGFGRQRQSFLQQYQYYIIALIVILLLLAVFYKYRLEKKKDPEYSWKDLLKSVARRIIFWKKKK